MDPKAREMVALSGPGVLAQVEALEHLVPPGVFERILVVVRDVDDAAADRMRESEQLWFDRVAEHFAHPEALFHLVHLHVLGFEDTDCCENRGRANYRFTWPERHGATTEVR